MCIKKNTSTSTNFKFNKPLQAGVYSFKNLKSGFLQLNFSTNYKNPDYEITPERLTDFMEEVKNLITEMYATDVSFVEPVDLPY